RVEGNNFDIRKVVLQYDDVMNQQRLILYKQRKEVLYSENIRDSVLGMIDNVIERIVQAHCPPEEVPEDWDLAAIVEYGNRNFLKEGQVSVEQIEGKEPDEIIEYLKAVVRQAYE